MKKLSELAMLTEAKYHHDKFALLPILEQENKLRAELAKLEEHSQLGRRLDYNDTSEIHALGADILWLKWIERSQKNLNIELAKVLAQKEKYLAEVRKSFGKNQAAQTKLVEHKSNRAKQIHSNRLDIIISSAALKNQ